MHDRKSLFCLTIILQEDTILDRGRQKIIYIAGEFEYDKTSFAIIFTDQFHFGFDRVQ
jgi:hypothetical protein